MSRVKLTLSTCSDGENWRLWDEFLSVTKRGIYLQSSDWLKSYKAFGFQSFLILAKDSHGSILGGMGVVLAQTGPFKVLICPYGPILIESDPDLYQSLLVEFKMEGKRKGAFLAQISLPFDVQNTGYFPDHFISNELSDLNISESGNAILFKYVTGIDGVRAVKLNYERKGYDPVFENYNSGCRRNVRKSSTFGHEFLLAKEEKEMREAYAVIEANAENQGYAIRTWEEFGPTLLDMVKNGACLIACCKNQDQIKGALVVFQFGKKMHYIMGGTLREEVDQKVGHFLHDQIIRLGVEKGYDFYDISMGGSDGVVRFKEGFGGQVIPLNDTRYWVLKPGYFWIYQKLMPFVQRNKRVIASLLSKSR